jgi:hypothetical protein
MSCACSSHPGGEAVLNCVSGGEESLGSRGELQIGQEALLAFICPTALLTREAVEEGRFKPEEEESLPPLLRRERVMHGHALD